MTSEKSEGAAGGIDQASCQDHSALDQATSRFLRTKWPVFIFVALFLLSFAGSIAFRIDSHKTREDIFDYFAYAFPALAALAAGLNVVLQRERLWFLVSAVLVFSGFVAYLSKAEALGQTLYQVIYLIAIVAIVAILVVVSRLQESRWESMRWVNPIFGLATIVIVPLQFCMVIGINNSSQATHSQAARAIEKMQCQRVSGDISTVLLLSCTAKH